MQDNTITPTLIQKHRVYQQKLSMKTKFSITMLLTLDILSSMMKFNLARHNTLSKSSKPVCTSNFRQSIY